jgi:hypothetical protein
MSLDQQNIISHLKKKTAYSHTTSKIKVLEHISLGVYNTINISKDNRYLIICLYRIMLKRFKIFMAKE